jgi:DNA replication protein DnaC
MPHTEICEQRYQTRSTILTSQVPVDQWHEQIGDATIADGILDRLVRNSTASNCAASPMGKKLNPPRDDKDDKKK